MWGFGRNTALQTTLPHIPFNTGWTDSIYGLNMEKPEIYTEKLMNMILDAIDDIIVIHDSEHTIIWMNRAGEKAFGINVDDVIGTKCYSLFGNTTSCADCLVKVTDIGSPNNCIRRRIIPKTGVECDCSTIPYFNHGKLELVVQHLRPVENKE